MYFEYLGIDSAMSGVLKISMTMLVGPFPNNHGRDSFLDLCHQVVSEKMKNPHKIKFILHDQLPVKEADPNEFMIDEETGGMVSAPVYQWVAIPPEKFLKSLQTL